MTLREKQRLRRVIQQNAREYSNERRAVVLEVMRGQLDEKQLSQRRWLLTLRATYIAEAVTALEDHADNDGS